MQTVIYNSKFFCKYCNKDVVEPVYGYLGSTFPENEEEVQAAKEWCEHFHWIDYHRRCAVCGEIVIGGELNLIVDGAGISSRNCL